ncbi:hypothetical protein R3O55_012935 [Bacteroides hominis]|uniref:hypothetical protein n=2 Tax=Bacteroides hominis TaxID=2763023 RepID=UPI002948D50D|nr:hypothetical protein [Bacteroides hominis (ex Liu et al. 2022)]MDV6152702.1 hypothetical protein [Bacteroides hominis (ex Liu et al. 2022)]
MGELGKKILKENIPSDVKGELYYVMSKEEQFGRGQYDESYTIPQLFWRGDTREPDTVFDTGFTTQYERSNKTRSNYNHILWRDELDDLVPESAVCLARDFRGSAFFPLDTKLPDKCFIYAIAATQAVNTYKAQQKVDEMENRILGPEHYKYDPKYENDADDSASAIWQFQEYAVHRVEKSKILGCFKLQREFLDPTNLIAGIQFQLELPFIPNPNASNYESLSPEIKMISDVYAQLYPSPERYLSYMGIVTICQETPIVIDRSIEIKEEFINKGEAI